MSPSDVYVYSSEFWGFSGTLYKTGMSDLQGGECCML